MIVVNEYSDIKDSNFEPIWSDLEYDYSSSSMLLVLKKGIV